MKLKSKELKKIMQWFEFAEDNLDDTDMDLYDKIKDHLEEEGELEDSSDSEEGLFLDGNAESWDPYYDGEDEDYDD